MFDDGRESFRALYPAVNRPVWWSPFHQVPFMIGVPQLLVEEFRISRREVYHSIHSRCIQEICVLLPNSTYSVKVCLINPLEYFSSRHAHFNCQIVSTLPSRACSKQIPHIFHSVRSKSTSIFRSYALDCLYIFTE